MSKRHRKRERRRRNKNKQKLSRTEIWIIAMLVVAILLVLAFIAVSLLWNDSKTVTKIYCPSGYYGEHCERNDFIDALGWTANEAVSTADAQCSSGYSFRTWAPGASSVRLLIQTPERSTPYYYFMVYFIDSYLTSRSQDNGFWFILICSWSPGTIYKFQVDHNSESVYSLSLGSTERTLYFYSDRLMYSSSSQEIFNVIPRHWNPDWGLDTGNIVHLLQTRLCTIFISQPMPRKDVRFIDHSDL